MTQAPEDAGIVVARTMIASAMATCSPMMLDFLTGCTNGVGTNDTHGLPSCGYVPSVAEDLESKTEMTNHDGDDWTFNNLYCTLCLLMLLLVRPLLR